MKDDRNREWNESRVSAVSSWFMIQYDITLFT